LTPAVRPRPLAAGVQAEEQGERHADGAARSVQTLIPDCASSRVSTKVADNNRGGMRLACEQCGRQS
jgi:hypothetical protein